jgi:hypothetical protein
MLEQLIKLVEQNATEVIFLNPAVPHQYKGAAVMEVANQIFGGLQPQIERGNLVGLATMLKDYDASAISDPTLRKIMGSVSSNLTSKFGVSAPASVRISSSLLPCVLSKFVLVKWLGRFSAHNFLVRYYLT